MKKLLFFDPKAEAKTVREAEALLHAAAESEAFGPYDDELSALVADCLAGGPCALADDQLEGLNAAGLPDGAFGAPAPAPAGKHTEDPNPHG